MDAGAAHSICMGGSCANYILAALTKLFDEMGDETPVYVGVPAFVAHGDPVDSSIADGIVEAMEVDPADVDVVEQNGKFYVFIHGLPLTFPTASHVIAQSTSLQRTYKRNLVRLTNLVSRSDKHLSELLRLRDDVSALRMKRDAMKADLHSMT